MQRAAVADVPIVVPGRAGAQVWLAWEEVESAACFVDTGSNNQSMSGNQQ
jgi:hypothetical protein